MHIGTIIVVGLVVAIKRWIGVGVAIQSSRNAVVLTTMSVAITIMTWNTHRGCFFDLFCVGTVEGRRAQRGPRHRKNITLTDHNFHSGGATMSS
jgi:hypothetical protein